MPLSVSYVKGIRGWGLVKCLIYSHDAWCSDAHANSRHLQFSMRVTGSGNLYVWQEPGSTQPQAAPTTRASSWVRHAAAHDAVECYGLTSTLTAPDSYLFRAAPNASSIWSSGYRWVTIASASTRPSASRSMAIWNSGMPFQVA